MHILYMQNKRDDASGRCHHFCGEFKKNIEAEKKIDKQKYIDKNQIKQVYTSNSFLKFVNIPVFILICKQFD